MKKTCIIVMVGMLTSYAAAADPQPKPQSESATITPCDLLRIVGTIESIDSDAGQLVVEGTVVQLSDDTVLRAGRNTLTLSDLEVGKTVVVVGSMDEAVFNADRVNVRYAAAGFATAGQKGQRGIGQRGAGRGRGLGRGQGQFGAGAGWCGPMARMGDVAQAGQGKGRGCGRRGWQADRPCMGTFQSPKGRQGPGPNPTPCDGYVRIEGTLTSIDAESAQLAVGETTVNLTDDTIIKMGRTLMDFEALEVGQTVAVCGKPADDGAALVASKVSIRFRGRTAPQPPPATQ